MKRANEYARAIRKFHQTLLRRYGRPRIPPVREPIDELMYAVLSRWAPEGRAMAAAERLRRASIDLNDLRVTPVVEIVTTLGDDFPRARETAEALYRVLNGVFNRRYTLDLSFLKSMGKRDRERMMSGVSGIDPHDAGMFLLRCYRSRHVPVSPDAFAALRHEGLVDPEASSAEIRAFLSKIIPVSQAEVFACLLKRHIAANPPPMETPAVPAPAAAPAVPTHSKKAGPSSDSSAAAKPTANAVKPNQAPARTSSKPQNGDSPRKEAAAKPVKQAPSPAAKADRARKPVASAANRRGKPNGSARAGRAGGRRDKGPRTRSGSRR